MNSSDITSLPHHNQGPLNASTHPLLWRYLPKVKACLDQAQVGEKPILVGLSGGVDSSVTALCLVALGCKVSGLFMKNWDEDDGTEYCTAQADFADARAIANQLGIEIHGANFAADYWDNVFNDFLKDYKAGLTPNPDILCNREIKFQVFKDYAKALGFETIATGHYAKLEIQTLNGTPAPTLCQSADTNKDQTYFLNGVHAANFEGVVFPLGGLLKTEVRAIADEANLSNSKKKDSTGICFIGERRFKDFLSQYLESPKGPIISTEGDLLGEHQGLMFYTLGQRKGIGIGGTSQGLEKPWFVAEKRLETNELIVTQAQYHPLLMRNRVFIPKMNWITPLHSLGLNPGVWFGMGRCRHRQPLFELQIDSDALQGEGLWVNFTQAQWAVTPGQYLVIYANEICLGGGQIMETIHLETQDND